MSKQHAIVVETAKGFMLQFDDESRDHFIHNKETGGDNGMTRGQYYRAMKSNFKDEYDIENPVVIMTKPVETAELPSDIKQELESAFGPVPNFSPVKDADMSQAIEQAKMIDDIDEDDDYAVDPDGVVYSRNQLSQADIESVEAQLELDEETVEEGPQPIVEPIKTEQKMEQQTTAQQEQRPVSMFTKVNWYSRKTAGAATFVIGTGLHTPLQGATNIGQFVVDQMQRTTNVVRNSEAFIIDKLDISNNSREEIKEAIDNRAKAIIKAVQWPVTAPVNAISNTVKSVRAQRQEEAIHAIPTA